ncbi:MAG: N-acetylmuramoyl-L-alanine amidase [Oscillospiraceae bacterium]|nr:N-acetylmuramoyl-L-alanine amidase [Oscillospiraceae bacterium]
MAKIAVFAGHGGNNPGAVFGPLREKDYTLAVSNEVTAILRYQGYNVINNRTIDIDRSITADANLANSQNVDAVVEIHLNSNEGIPYSGTETFFSVFDTGRGRELATAINRNIVSLGFKDNGIKTRVNSEGTDYFGILRLTHAPAVLVETAFINNPQDMAMYDIGTMAEAIANGIMEVFPINQAQANIQPVAYGTVRTDGANLNIREFPSVQARVLGVIPNGGSVSVYGSSGNWYIISYSGISGYASADFIMM